MIEVTTEEGEFECRKLTQVTGTRHMDPPYTVYCGQSSIGEHVKSVETRGTVTVYPYSDHSGKMRCNSVVQNDGDLMCIENAGMERIPGHWQKMR